MHNGNTETSSQDDDDDPEGQGCAEDQGCEARLGRDDSPIECIIDESSSSQSNYSETQKKILWEREARAQRGHPTSNTEEEDDDNDDELADEVDPEPSPLASDPQAMAASSNTRDGDEDEDELADSDVVDRELNSPQTTMASSSKGKGKGKAPLKRGPLLAEDKKKFSQLVENLYDIVVIGALLYVGDDAAGCQLSSLFTGSPIVRQLIDENEVNVREILDRLTVAVKAPDVVADGFSIPTFNNESQHKLQQQQGDGLYTAKHVDAVTFLPGYTSQKLPWKHWLDLVGKEQLCIINWEDKIRPPGPDFDVKKLGAGELRCIAGSYVDAILSGGDDYEAFSVVRWTAEQSTLLNTHPNKGLIPLVITQSGTPLITRLYKKAKCGVKQGLTEDENDEEEEEEEEEEQHGGDWMDDCDEIQPDAALKHSRPLRGHAAQSHLQPKQSDCQRSIWPSGASNEEASQPHPPLQPTARVNPHQQSIQCSGAPVPMAHEEWPTLLNNWKWSAVRSTPFQHDSRLGPSTSRSHPPPSQAGTRNQPPPNSTCFCPQHQPLDLSPPRPAIKRCHPEWSDDERVQFSTAPHNHHIAHRSQSIPQDETNPQHPRDSAAIVPQASYQRSFQHYSDVHVEPTIEEHVEMGDWLTSTDQYADYHRRDDGQDYDPDCGYFDDIYGGDEQGPEGAEDEYEYDGRYEEYEAFE
ncbi:hypothetical protein BJV78DRAFT_1288807 [Lactifluus subvellereus]|nr:hypothetical protein BJV78DRAFT_1288807 [Lactifluus subvellereus]